MIPAVLPLEIRNDPKRSGEVAVYDHLAATPFLKGAVVFYSCEWLGGYEDLLRDGEADFVVAHPKIGYLVLEVKGGRVRRNVADGKWTTTDRNDKTIPIANPVRQAMKSKKVILQALLRRWPGKAPWITARHGVILPHSSRPANPAVLGAAAPVEIFAFKQDMPVGARILQMMAWTPDGVREPSGPLGPIGLALLEDFYGRDVDFSPRLAEVIEECENRLEALTATQTRYLDFLGHTKKAVIEGGAGTGKTVLAVERARRAAAEGRRVLLLCFNRPLATALSVEAVGSAAAVATFHEFCSRMCVTAGIDLDAIRAGCSESRFWAEKLPELITEIGLVDPPELYDDLIIDEGQDFKSAWIDALKLFLVPGASLFLFRDNFQDIYQGDDAAEIIGVEPLRLTENVRNSRRIFEASCRFRSGPADTCLGPDGAPISWVVAAPERTLRAVKSELNRLIGSDGVCLEDIAILSDCGATVGKLRDEPALAGGAWRPADKAESDCVIVDSVMRFKGLDRPVVILCGMENAEDEVAYVALTRAKSHLIVVGSEETLERLGRSSLGGSSSHNCSSSDQSAMISAPTPAPRPH